MNFWDTSINTGMTTELIFPRTSVFLSAKWGFKWGGLVTYEVPSSSSMIGLYVCVCSCVWSTRTSC